MLVCIQSVEQWTSSTRLRLNPAKSESLWCCTSPRLHLAETSMFNLPDGDVNPSDTVRNLGAFFDQAMTMKEHVNRLVKTCNFPLWRAISIRRSLLYDYSDAARKEFCHFKNWLLQLLVLPKCQQDRLQPVLNFLRVPQRITFKCCLLVYKSLHGLASAYIASCCFKSQLFKVDLGCAHPPKDDLVIPATKS